MPADNSIYDRLSHTWWEPDGTLNVLRSALNPVRSGYMRGVLVDELGLPLVGLPTLDIGCGGGLLAEEFARLGCMVTGVDPSRASLEVARRHARESELGITYVEGVGERLPFAAASFGVVYCCDVLEHVVDVAQVLVEAHRVLRPGGVFLFDTINRTVRSWLLMIKLIQDWKSTAFLPLGLHDWRCFIRPADLTGALSAAGLAVRHLSGIAPASITAALAAMRARAAGRISMDHMGACMALQLSQDRSSLYIGYAVRT